MYSTPSLRLRSRGPYDCSNLLLRVRQEPWDGPYVNRELFIGGKNNSTTVTTLRPDQIKDAYPFSAGSSVASRFSVVVSEETLCFVKGKSGRILLVRQLSFFEVLSNVFS